MSENDYPRAGNGWYGVERWVLEEFHDIKRRIGTVENDIKEVDRKVSEIGGGLGVWRAAALILLTAAVTAIVGILVPRPEPAADRALREDMARLVEEVRAQRLQEPPPLAAGDRR